ncbi:MAG: FtsH protease activity modulator HflK [Alphaproteobacteria bacterium]|nr:FtsH protease activity modulator HflK [Alphaproteobacteria bacterium]
MPWKNQGGGPGGGGSGPWGSRGPGGPQPPNLEDILRESQDRFRSLIPGGGGRSILIVLLIAVAAWLFSGVYKVDTDEQGVVLRFGKWVRTTQPGLHYHLPGPIESVITPAVTRINKIEVGFRSPLKAGKNSPTRQVPEEALMLTGDENIVDINFTVFWRIKDAGQFLFNIRNPEATVKSVAESAMRETIGQDRLEPILTKGRGGIEEHTKGLMQGVLDDYGAGVEISQVKLEKVDPPEPVLNAFRDVQAAKADQETLQNQAMAYRNNLVPKARGEAAQITQEAEAYKQEIVARATGNAKRFLSVYNAYKVAKDVTRRRMYLEAMEEVVGDLNKVIIDIPAGDGTGVLPYLPLSELLKQGSGAAGSSSKRTTRPAPSQNRSGEGGK